MISNGVAPDSRLDPLASSLIHHLLFWPHSVSTSLMINPPRFSDTGTGRGTRTGTGPRPRHRIQLEADSEGRERSILGDDRSDDMVSRTPSDIIPQILRHPPIPDDGRFLGPIGSTISDLSHSNNFTSKAHVLPIPDTLSVAHRDAESGLSSDFVSSE